jgi:hypothetical protein
MSSTILTTYLNDHLAGSVAALELLDLLSTSRPTSDHHQFTALRAEIEEDQRVLQQLLERLGAKESRVRKAAAWLTEKMGQAKLKFDDPGSGDLQTLEALETLGLGIQGKMGLWRALSAVAGTVPEIGGLDYPRLQQRAKDQFDRVEQLRLQAARSALG